MIENQEQYLEAVEAIQSLSEMPEDEASQAKFLKLTAAMLAYEIAETAHRDDDKHSASEFAARRE